MLREPPDLADGEDARVTLTPELAAAQLFPAVDAHGSLSDLLVPDVIGGRHCSIASRVRELLVRGEGAASRVASPDGAHAERGAADASERARRLRTYLTQPFLCTEPFGLADLGALREVAWTVRDGEARTPEGWMRP
jgi:F0F1-type ATP synthase beta subunit